MLMTWSAGEKNLRSVPYHSCEYFKFFSIETFGRQFFSLFKIVTIYKAFTINTI